VQFTGNGFLRKMVRHLVGAMIAVGQHRVDVEYIKKLLREGMPEDLKQGVARGWNTADACGLIKVDVEYPDEIKQLFEQPPISPAQTSSIEEKD
jgi:tRNA U38,U39,U40 pseudouridine synthase TruA